MRNMDQRINLSPPHMSGNEQSFIQHAFDSNWIASIGPNVDAFESEVSSLVGVKAALAVSSGTSAIHLALRLAGVEAGDVVFCSSLTFIASANPILYLGAIPIFIDSEPETWGMSVNALKKAFNDVKTGKIKKPKAVLVVNLYGQSADLDPIVELCDKHNVLVIEDAANSLGSTYKGKKSGTIGKIGIYSFNGNKIITTSGGGMLVSNDAEMIEKAKYWANQARDNAPYHLHKDYGYNYRMSNVLAGIGRGQLQVLKQRVDKRREIFNRYFKALNSIEGVQFMPEQTFGYSNRWLTVMTLSSPFSSEDTYELIDILDRNNIEARKVWMPLHMQPIYKDNIFYTHEKCYSVAENLFNTGICLPSGSNLSKEDQDEVISIMIDFLTNKYLL